MLLQRIFRVLFSLALALYLGGIVALGAILAPALAQSVRQDHITYPALPPGLDMERQTIGQLFGPVLYCFTFVEVICCAIMVSALAVETLRRDNGRRASAPVSLKLRSLFMLLLLALLAWDAFQLTPKVWQKRDQWRTAALANPAAAHGSLEDEFNSLHRQSELLGHAKVYTLLALLIATTWSYPLKNVTPSQKP